MGKTKVVLDTNVWLSAFGWKGSPRKILKLAIQDKISLIISPSIFNEFSKALDYPKFKFSRQRKARLKRFVLSIALLVIPKNKVNIIKEDPSDNMFLECAYESKASFIITGDSHLLKLKKFKNTRIVTPAEFLKYYKKS